MGIATNSALIPQFFACDERYTTQMLAGLRCVRCHRLRAGIAGLPHRNVLGARPPPLATGGGATPVRKRERPHVPCASTRSRKFREGPCPYISVLRGLISHRHRPVSRHAQYRDPRYLDSATIVLCSRGEDLWELANAVCSACKKVKRGSDTIFTAFTQFPLLRTDRKRPARD